MMERFEDNEMTSIQNGDHRQIAAPAVEALRRKFEGAGVFVELGYEGRIRIKLVTPLLNGVSEQEKQDTVWETLNAELGEQARSVSAVIAYGTDEL